MATESPLRPCSVCGQRDRQPRDVKDLGEGQTSIAHLKCCAAQGCLSCAQLLHGEMTTAAI